MNVYIKKFGTNERFICKHSTIYAKVQDSKITKKQQIWKSYLIFIFASKLGYTKTGQL